MNSPLPRKMTAIRTLFCSVIFLLSSLVAAAWLLDPTDGQAVVRHIQPYLFDEV